MTKPVKIRLDGYGSGEVLLGGHDIASSVMGMTIEVTPGPSGVEVATRLRPGSFDLEVEGARVGVDAETRAALELLGWISPEAAAGMQAQLREVDRKVVDGLRATDEVRGA